MSEQFHQPRPWPLARCCRHPGTGARRIADQNRQALTQVLYAQSAQADLLEARRFIAEEMGRARPELGKDVRSWPTSTPYVLFYQLSHSGLTVLRVLHQARDVGQLSF